MFAGFIDPEFLGCLALYGFMFIGALVWAKISD